MRDILLHFEVFPLYRPFHSTAVGSLARFLKQTTVIMAPFVECGLCAGHCGLHLLF